MITLQADPLIEWDETNTSIYTQTQDAQNWVAENLLNLVSVDNTETIARSGKSDLTRITEQTYTNGTRTLLVARTYTNNNNCAVAFATYTMS